MGSESSFTPEAFSFSGDNGEESASSSSLFSDTRKSLDAFLAQERDGGFLSEICTCADDEKERGSSRTSKKKKNGRQKKANASGSSASTSPVSSSSSRSSRSSRRARDTEFTQEARMSFAKTDGVAADLDGFGESTDTFAASFDGVGNDNAVVETRESQPSAVHNQIEDKEYIPSDNPMVNAIHDHVVAGAPLSDDEQDFIAQIVITHLKAILSLFGEENAVIDEYEDDDHNLIFDISQGDLAVLIGRHGFTLDGLQNVINAFVSNELHFYYPIIVDVEGYKERRRQKITSIALSAATRARERHGKVSLAPMSAADRRLVHLTLMNEKDISTHSEGYEPNRRVVVSVIKKGKRRS